MKYKKGVNEHSVRITPPIAYIPMIGDEFTPTAADQQYRREKQEMEWRRMIKTRLNFQRPYIICVDITARKVTCELYALGITRTEREQFESICREVVNDDKYVI